MRKIALTLLLTMSLAACGDDSKSSSQGAKKVETISSGETFSVTTNWPKTDGKEQVALADDLTKENDYVIIDGSGSMNETCGGNVSKHIAAETALQEYARTVPASANLGLFAFDNKGTTERLPLGINNRDAFNTKLHQVAADSGTPLGEAIVKATANIEAQAKRQLGFGVYNLVIVTDGMADDPDRMDRAVKYILARTPINVYTIGFCINEKHPLNQPGKTFYVDAHNLNDVRRGLSQVIAESNTFDK